MQQRSAGEDSGTKPDDQAQPVDNWRIDDEDDAPDPPGDGVDEIAENELDATDATASGLDPHASLAADGDGEIELTIVENSGDRRLTKSYRLAADGKTIEEGPRPKTGHGRLVRARLDRAHPMASLGRILEELKPNQAIMAGQLPGPAPMRRMILKAEWERLPDAERALDGDGALWRGTCIDYAEGQPALLLLDLDSKDWQPALRQKVGDAGDWWAVLAWIDPQWQTVGFLARPSVSSSVREGGGLHLYAVVQDGGDAGRYVQTLFDRLLLAGYGYAVVDKGGEPHVRTLIDRNASGNPHFLSFEADPVLEPPLQPRPGGRVGVAKEGTRIDASKLADLTLEERQQVAGIKAQLTGALADQANVIRLQRRVATIERLEKKGVSRAEAERRVLAAAEAGRLPLDETYFFDDGRAATGREILDAPEAFVGCTGADPLEPSYPNDTGITRNKAKWYQSPGARGLSVFSFAHGPRRYILAYDAEDIVELVPKLEGGVVEQAKRLQDIYAALYWPVNEMQAWDVLGRANLPSPAALAFGHPDKLTLDHLAELLLAEDVEALLELRALGVFFERALALLRLQAGMGLVDGLDGFDWSGLNAKLDAAVAARARPAVAELLNANTLLQLDIQPPEPLLGSVIARATRTFVVGPTGSGKTQLSYGFAVAMAAGRGFLHWRCSRPCRVLLIDGEMAADLVVARLKDTLRRAKLDTAPERLFVYSLDLVQQLPEHYRSVAKFAPLCTDEGQRFLMALCAALKPDVVLLDNLMSLLGTAALEPDKWEATLPLVSQLTASRIAQIWFDHTNKAGGHYGTIIKQWLFDTVGEIEPLQDKQDKTVAFTLGFSKARRRTPENRMDYETVAVRLKDDTWSIELASAASRPAKVEPKVAIFHDLLLDAIKAKPTQPGETTKDAWLDECIRQGLIEPAEPKETSQSHDRRLAPFRKAKSQLIMASWIRENEGLISNLKYKH
jgi:hypothetical protein